jgi:hypothetical protein
MDMQEQLREAILEELNRQAEIGALKVAASEDPASVTLDGRLNLDDLIMVIAGSMAGGP